MERFDVKRGLVKQVTADGGLAALARRYFENVEGTESNSFSASHGIMTSIAASYNEQGALVAEVTNVPPNFEDPEAMKAAMDARRRWTTFLDEATGYDSKQRGNKAKEWAKKASKAQSAISGARHFMRMSENLPDEVRAQAESMIEEIGPRWNKVTIPELLDGRRNCRNHSNEVKHEPRRNPLVARRGGPCMH